jgi:hypothetical protein
MLPVAVTAVAMLVSETTLGGVATGATTAAATAIRAECPATVEDDRHDQRITHCLALHRTRRLPL